MADRIDPQAPEMVPMPSGWRHDIESAIRSLRYGAHPCRSPHADDLEKMLEHIDLANMKATLAARMAEVDGDGIASASLAGDGTTALPAESTKDHP